MKSNSQTSRSSLLWNFPAVLAAALWLAVATGPDAGATVIIQGSGASHLAFEAEANPTLINGTPTFWAAKAEATASGGQALIADGPNSTGDSPHSFAQYSIRFATAGTYYVYYRWRADESRTGGDVFTANSTWFGATWGAYSTPAEQENFYTSSSNDTQAPANNAWAWRREADDRIYEVGAAEVGSVVVFTMGTREAGMIFDRFIFSTVPDLTAAQLDALVNSETDIVIQDAGANFAAFEADGAKAELINGTPTFWAAKAEANASGGQALVADGPNSTGDSPHSFAQYSIRFATAGTYYVYYRWRADESRTGGDVFTANSTWFGATWGAYSTPAEQENFYTSSSNDTQAPANNAWAWRREGEDRIYEVGATEVGSVVVFTMGTREAGMIFDRFVFSTVPDLTAAQLDALPNSGSAAPAPEIGTATGSAALNQVTVVFTRPLNTATVSANSFNASGSLTVSAATVDTADPRIVRLTTSAQTEGTAYTLTVNGITDTSGTPIQPDSTVTFTAWLRVAGWITKEIYFGITGGLIDDLYNAPQFPDQPDRVEYVRGFELDRDPLTDNYGARLSAFFHPTAGGTYDFFVANDDEAELLLSSDTSEANLVSLGVFFLSPREFEEPLAFSGNLAAGQSYLLRGLLKQGAADVYLRVGARRNGETTIPPVLAGDLISTWVNPDLGRVTIAQQPANATAAAGQRGRFAVAVEGSGQPLYYQWQVDGVDIPNAIRPVYVTPVLAAADGGKKYRCRISAAGVDTLSDEVTLTVSGSAPSSQQPYIGVNFVGGGNSLPGPLLPQDVAGVVPQENWNNLTEFTFDFVPLDDATGAATPVTLTVDFLTETFYSGTIVTGDADGILMQGLVTAGASIDPVYFVFGNVPAGQYQVLIYSLGFNFSPAYEQDYTLTAGSTHTPITGRAEIGLNWNANPAYRRITSTDPNNRATGNYVQFDNVSPAADGSLTLTVTWVGEGGNTHEPAINALQLVRVVEVTEPPVLGAPSVQGENLLLNWTGGNPPFAVERRDTLTGVSTVVTTTSERTASVPLTGTAGFIQVRGSE